ncbi:MAG: L-cystine transport system permease protein YecS [Anaerolineae bacterium]|nr:L-cystine transport system permease protein YecS [Anaerolineae bacterium]
MDQMMLFLQRIGPDFWQGTLITIRLTLVALTLGAALGLPTALARVYGGKWLSRLAVAYIEIFRGTPLLVQLFVVYYGLPDVGLTLSRFAAAYITLGLNSGAYQAEYFRGAIQAIGAGQMTAARAIGMSKIKAIRYIILPQALRLALPAWSNEAISMVKYTAIVFLIAVPDLMTKAKILSSRYFNPIPVYATVALVYIFLVLIATLIMRTVERRMQTPGLELEVERH